MTLQKHKTKTHDIYSVEFFHIYTDETIGSQHTRSIEYLKTVRDAWNIEMSLVVLIDDYNPKEHKLLLEELLSFLHDEGVSPDYFAFESDMCRYADVVLESIESNKLKKSYKNYITKNSKYPCSLLTTTWYLMRLGVFDYQGVIKPVRQPQLKYEEANRLINILPADYRVIEEKVHKILKNSSYKKHSQNIQALFYDTDINRSLDLF